MANSLRALKRRVHRLLGRAVGLMLPSGAVHLPENFELWEKRGFHITPVHFYSPIPDTRELRKRYPRQANLWGVNLRAEEQRRLLTEIFPEYADHYNELPARPGHPSGFYLGNEMFAGIDPHVYVGMIAHYRPQTIIELGSGYSTLLASEARVLLGNSRLVVVDPFPRSELFPAGIPNATHVHQRVEELDVAMFLELKENDILFVDTSHVVRTAGDVCFVILDVLPRLARGVIVHFHDIYLPFDYPESLVLDRHMFWTEQYLLQAFLIGNCEAEVLFGSHFAAATFPEEIRAAFPLALSWHGASFWLRKI